MATAELKSPTQPDWTRPAPARTSFLDPAINYQRLRHGGLARWLRSAIYRLLVGRANWPLVFRPPVGEGPRLTSPHLYVHLPFCRQICPHCPYNKTLYRDSEHDRYARALAQEMTEYFVERKPPRVRSLYFGGGTPSVTPELIRLALETAGLYLEGNCDIGVEVHPADATPELLDDLRAMGVNRVSLGVETFRPDLLKQLGRTYSPEQADESLRLARSRFPVVDVNLICAIPGQSESETAADTRRCLDLGVDQVSAYTLFTFVHTTLGKRVEQRRVPVYGDASRVRALWSIAKTCKDAGFVRTSPWNYTRPGITPYSTVTRESYVGFGAGASSKVDGVFWFNTFALDAYLGQTRNRPALVMETSERFRRFHWLYWQLYGTVVDAPRYRELFGRDLERDFGFVFAALRLLGMAHREGPRWRVSEFGAIWMHRLQQLFSITYIDQVWQQCQAEAWPREVVLT
jgi:oxygen-independent coproporphyrinogen-3 oxidase